VQLRMWFKERRLRRLARGETTTARAGARGLEQGGGS